MAIAWSDLDDDEKTALRRLNRGPYPELAAALGERLVARGLAVRRERGIGISREGRELVIAVLLEGRGS